MIRNIAIAVVLILGAVVAYMYLGPQNSSQPDGDDAIGSASMEINFGNNFWKPISAVELSPAGTDAYVAIPLPDGSLGAGDFVKHAIPDGSTVCKYDLRFTRDSGDIEQRMGVDLCSATYYHFEEQG